MTTKAEVAVEAVKEAAAAEDAEKKLFESVTVGDLGLRLVTGTGPLDGSKARNTSLAFRDWTAADERKLAAFRKKHKNLSPAAMVTHVLGRFVTQWGEHNFAEMSDAQKLNVMGLATAADVFHAWVLLRTENLGEDYTIEFLCPECDGKVVYTIDLESIETQVPVSPSTNLAREFDLRKGIQYEKERRKTARVAPLRWRTHLALGENPRIDFSEIKLAVIEGSLIGLDGIEGEIIVPSVSVDTLVKRDLEALFDFINDESPGPDLSVKLDCPHCAVNLARPMRWEYDLFFSV